MLNLPPQVIEFLRQPNPAVIAVQRPDGFPMTVATWYVWDEGRVLVNMLDSRSRLAWMKKNPKVGLTVFSDNWYTHVSLYGTVVAIEDDPGLSGIDRLAFHYTGHRYRNRKVRRVNAWIEPVGWHGWDPSGRLSSPGVEAS